MGDRRASGRTALLPADGRRSGRSHRTRARQAVGHPDGRASISIQPPDLLELVTHELRTPVTSLYGAAQLLDRATLRQGERQELLVEVAEGAARLVRFLGDLLALAEASVGVMPVEPVAVERILDEAVASVQARCVTARIIVDRSVPVGPAIAEPAALRHALENLVAHAALSMPPGVPVRVTVSARPGRVVTTIRERSRSQPRRGPGSAGLDPAIVPGGRLWDVTAEALVHAMGGELSMTRRGALRTMRLTLPAASRPLH